MWGNRTKWTARLTSAAAVIWAVCLPYAAQAQFDGRRILTCSSVDGRRGFCAADTRGGVRLIREVGDGRREEGSTYGYTDRGIWVDRGCGAEFALSAAGPPAVPADEEFTRLRPGTLISVRTDETIASDRGDGRIYTGVVDQDVRGTNGRLAIPRGSPVELIVRVAPDNDLTLDLESVTVNGQRYAIRADTERIESRDGVGANRRTGEYVGGGALLGTIIGAIAGGGKGAAIGAIAGAAAGAGGQVLTRGRAVRVPPESLLTFRLDRPLEMGVADAGFTRDGFHYHDYRPR